MEKISTGGVFLKDKQFMKTALAGIGAGAVNGLFGAGGGMVLVPLLTLLTDMEDTEIFPASVSIILPICLVSLSVTYRTGIISWEQVFYYLIGSAAGGIIAGICGRHIPTLWLHRILGAMILWGGVRYLC